MVRTSQKKYQRQPDDLIDDSGDILISLLSSWIIKPDVLGAHDLAINFHPAPPSLPGTASYNLALYWGHDDYGVTCHRMTEKVDAGEIIETSTFPIFPWDDAHSLQQRTHTYLLTLFYGVVSKIAKGEKLEANGLAWHRKAYTRHDLEELCRITLDMDEDEVTKRVKATAYPGRPGAFIEIEPGIEGLIHVSEMSWVKSVADPSEIVNKGEEIEAIVLSIQKDEGKISLGIKQTARNPWDDVEDN